MNLKEKNDNELEVRKKRKRFKEHHLLVKIGFIFSSITLAYAIVYFIILWITQRPGELGLVIIIATAVALAYISLILSSISFSKGLNGYNISGFVFASIVLAVYVAGLVFALELLFQA
ncbi:MAG: hypothetical protein ACTSSB_14975 [Candidatus Heimdallarchaeota archaeon]